MCRKISLRNIKSTEITYDPHLFDRKEHRNLNLDKIEQAIKSGHIVEEKCEFPNKICFERYFGKENITYTVITKIHENFIEAKTAWTKKGR